MSGTNAGLDGSLPLLSPYSLYECGSRDYMLETLALLYSPSFPFSEIKYKTAPHPPN